MKKIFYFLLLMISGVVWGQHPVINKINDIVTSGITLPNESVNSFVPRLMNCEFHTTGYYNFYYYVAPNDMDFEFTLKGNIDKFHFMLWKLSKNSNPNDIFVRTGSSSNEYTTINPIRAVYSNITKEKGLKVGKLNDCISNSTDGFVSAFENGSKLKEGEIIVIAIYGTDNPILELTISGAKIIDNLVFDSHCYTDDYLLADVKTKITDDIRIKDPSINVGNIQFYKPDNTSTNDNISYANGIEQILYARVYDDSGKLVYIYKPIRFKFIPELIYTVQGKTEQYCATSISFSKEDLIHKISPTINSSKYADYEVYVDGVIVNGNISLNNSNSYRVKLKYIGTEFCPVREFSDEVELKLENSNPRLDIGKYAEVCNSEILSEADILSALGVDATIYEIVSMPVVPYNFTGNEAEFDVQVRDRADNTCTSNIVKFKVIRKPNVALKTLPNFEKCRSEFTLSDLQAKIAEVRNSDNSIDLTINYNSISYTETQLQSLYDLILRTTTQTDFNLSIIGSKTGFCESTVPLKITLNNSSVPRVSFDVLLSPSCLGVTEDYTFSVDEIKEYIKGDLGFTNIADFEILNSDVTPFQPVNVLANSNVTLTFKIRKKLESCLSEEMYLIVETVNQPNVVSATYSDKFCEGEVLTINDDLLEHYFRVNVLHYIIFIDGIEYIQGNPIQKILDFRGNTSLNISIEFQNFLRRTCSTTVNLTINKKPTLDVIPPALNNYITNAKVVYCEEDDTNAKNQIQTILDYIQNNYSLTSSKTKDQIFAEFNSVQGSVDVDFYNSDYCGKITLKLNYQKNALPNIDVKNPEPLCTGEKYKLDFTTQTGYENYNYYVEKEDGTSVLGTYTFGLDAGNYKITIEDSNSTTLACSVVKTLEIKNTIPPTINKITINEKSVIVSAKGNGKLEYALFDSDGKVIVDWQTKNELIIPDKIKNNDFTVRVRLNNCGVSEEVGIIYLDLPNVVTPNNDGFNDIWKPRTKGQANDLAKSYKLLIFDRYGKQILNKEGIGIIEWDGTLNGKHLADGTYWYLLQGSKSGIIEVQYSGSILVKRKIN